MRNVQERIPMASATKSILSGLRYVVKRPCAVSVNAAKSSPVMTRTGNMNPWRIFIVVLYVSISQPVAGYAKNIKKWTILSIGMPRKDLGSSGVESEKLARQRHRTAAMYIRNRAVTIVYVFLFFIILVML